MGSIPNRPNHEQVCWSVIDATGQPMPAIEANKEDRNHEAETYRNLTPHINQPGYSPRHETLSPHPILTDKKFILDLEYFHGALVKAVVDIVDRWWTDTDADFPTRMPLEAPVEAALQWLDEQSRAQRLPPFKDRLGNWRPDFLVTDNDSTMGLGFEICEINSRTPDNVVVHSAHKHRKMRQLMRSSPGLQPTGDYDEWAKSLLGLFRTDLPVHILRGRDQLDRQAFVKVAELGTGICPQFVNIDELELNPDEISATGYSLFYRGQDPPEKIHQVVTTLFPDEYSLLPQDMLRQLATVAVNDLRVSLMVNDERFLGIILQELDDLVNRHGILEADQARVLQEGIVPTLLPGSPELKNWIQTHQQNEMSKDDYILKAARQSRGRGHLLGADLSPQEWAAIILDMQDPSIRPGVTSYVLQPYVRQVEFDIIGEEDQIAHASLMYGEDL
ncbi:hypothetical protein N8T08_005270 [Aspergillus melleus]|uniref:Uncharacterized protein n=1 Tax=Aspergillus melleus TaxID=138277 RepID=A0ACC3BG74_9EURO|nr:hypothetical protein N8T08_005270 [Aspergillus melleus]